MTLKEAFIFKAGTGTTDVDASAALSFAGLDPDATWSDSIDKCKFYDALISNIMRAGVGVKMEREGGYTIEYDTVAKKEYAYSLAVESGCQTMVEKYNPKPKVQNKTYLW